jgi:nucleolin
MKEDAPASKKRAAEETEAPAKKAKVEESAAEGASTTVFVGQLSWNVDNDWLQSEFAECGEVVSARVVTDRESGRSRGFGYVEFTTPEAAQKAMELAGKEVDGRAIKVDVSTPRAPRDNAERPKKTFVRLLSFLSSTSHSTDLNSPFSQNDQLSGPPTTTLFVGNLPFSASEDAVWTAFADFGDVSSVCPCLRSLCSSKLS